MNPIVSVIICEKFLERAGRIAGGAILIMEVVGAGLLSQSQVVRVETKSHIINHLYALTTYLTRGKVSVLTFKIYL